MVSASSASNFGMALHLLCLSNCANAYFSDRILPALCAVHPVRTALPSTGSTHGTLHISCSVCLHLVILVLSRDVAPVMGELDVQLLRGPINAFKGHPSWITSHHDYAQLNSTSEYLHAYRQVGCIVPGFVDVKSMSFRILGVELVRNVSIICNSLTRLQEREVSPAFLSLRKLYANHTPQVIYEDSPLPIFYHLLYHPYSASSYQAT